MKKQKSKATHSPVSMGFGKITGIQPVDSGVLLEALMAWAKSARMSIDPGFEIHTVLESNSLVSDITFREAGAVRFVPPGEIEGPECFSRAADPVVGNAPYCVHILDLQIYDRAFFRELVSYVRCVQARIDGFAGVLTARVVIGREDRSHSRDYEGFDSVCSLVLSGRRTLIQKGRRVSAKSGEILFASAGEPFTFTSDSEFIAIELLSKMTAPSDLLRRDLFSYLNNAVEDCALPDHYPRSLKSGQSPVELKKLYASLKGAVREIDSEIFVHRSMLEHLSCAGFDRVPPFVSEPFPARGVLQPVSAWPLLWSRVEGGRFLVVASGGYSGVVERSDQAEAILESVARGNPVRLSEDLSGMTESQQRRVRGLLSLLWGFGAFQCEDRFFSSHERPIAPDQFKGGIFSARVRNSSA